MLELSNSDIVATIAVAISLVSAAVVIAQYRDSKKPAIVTWISKDRFGYSLPDDPDYLFVKNVSTNTIEQMQIKLEFVGYNWIVDVDRKWYSKHAHPFPYLNPGEKTSFVIPINEIVRHNQSLFEIVKTKENKVREVPKQDIPLEIRFLIKCRYGFLPILNTMTFKDDFFLEWRAPKKKEHLEEPLLFIYHQRNGHTIENSEETFKPD